MSEHRNNGGNGGGGIIWLIIIAIVVWVAYDGLIAKHYSIILHTKFSNGDDSAIIFDDFNSKDECRSSAAYKNSLLEQEDGISREYVCGKDCEQDHSSSTYMVVCKEFI